MRLGTKSLIGLSAYGTVRSIGPSNPTKPNDFPAVPCRKPGIKSLEILDSGPKAEQRAVVRL